MNRENAKKLLFDVADQLDKHRLPFFLIQGTALGAFRDNDFTPTEKDIDLGVLQEYLTPTAFSLIGSNLNLMGYDVECVAMPFFFPRTMVVIGHDCKMDIVGYSQWEDKRFACSPVRDWLKKPYAIVHDRATLENYEVVNLFGRTFHVPAPIETYLELEYGPDWRIPKDDNVSRTRVYNFLEDNSVSLERSM